MQQWSEVDNGPMIDSRFSSGAIQDSYGFSRKWNAFSASVRGQSVKHSTNDGISRPERHSNLLRTLGTSSLEQAQNAIGNFHAVYRIVRMRSERTFLTQGFHTEPGSQLGPFASWIFWRPPLNTWMV